MDTRTTWTRSRTIPRALRRLLRRGRPLTSAAPGRALSAHPGERTELHGLRRAAGTRPLRAPPRRPRLGAEGRTCRAAIAGSTRSARPAPARGSSMPTRSAASRASPRAQPEAGRGATTSTRLVFQAWDMLAGRLLPELGGSRAHLDIVGINYYWTNQWDGSSSPPTADPAARRRRPAPAAASRPGAPRLGALRRRPADHRDGPLGEHAAAWLRELAARESSSCCGRACRCAASASTPSWGCRNGTRRRSGRRWDCGTRSATATRTATV